MYVFGRLVIFLFVCFSLICGVLLSLGWGNEETFYFTQNNASITLMEDKTWCKVADPDAPLWPGTDIVVDYDLNLIVVRFTTIGLC